MEERRAADRTELPERLTAAFGSAPVRIVELSRIGARIEHEVRLPLALRSMLRIDWRGDDATIAAKVARSEIAGKTAAGLLYVTGLQFERLAAGAEELLAAILLAARAPRQPFPAAKAPVPSGSKPFLDDNLPGYIRCELENAAWKISCVASPDQPPEGFTISRLEGEQMKELARAYAVADLPTRIMMRNALAARLSRGEQPAYA